MSLAVEPTRFAFVAFAGRSGLAELHSRQLWSGRRPIAGWKRNVPKFRCSLPELDSHFCRTHQLFSSEYYAAFQLFPTERVLQNKSLISDHFGVETDQRTMGADHERPCPFGKGQAQFF